MGGWGSQKKLHCARLNVKVDHYSGRPLYSLLVTDRPHAVGINLPYVSFCVKPPNVLNPTVSDLYDAWHLISGHDNGQTNNLSLNIIHLNNTYRFLTLQML